MQTVGGIGNEGKRGIVQSGVTVGVLLVVLCGMVQGQIEVNEPGLHDGESVYGLVTAATPDPNVNDLSIFVWAWGETDPNLYSNVAFHVVGLYSDVNLVNIGAIDVNAIGGIADANDGDAYARILTAGGVYVAGDANNTGDITVTAVGGTADANDGIAYANIEHAYGLFADGDVNNAGDIRITAAGGPANATGSFTSAYAQVVVNGIEATYGDVNNTGDITVAGAGGTGDSGGATFAYAVVRGVAAEGPIDNTGDIAVTATGGTATGGVYAWAEAIGLSAYQGIDNAGAVTVTAVGGTVTAGGDSMLAEAYAIARGLLGNGIDNTGTVSASAAGGTANTHGNLSVAAANADAQGILSSSGDLTNAGAIDVSSEGGTATSEHSAFADGNAYGIHLGSGTVTNSGALDVRMVGGTAHGVSSFEGDPYSAVEVYADANTVGYGVFAQHVVNTGQVYVNGNGGQAEAQTHVDIYGSAETRAYARADAETYGIYATADVNNVATIQAVAVGGSATADADVDASAWAGVSAYAHASADANAYGLYGGTDVVNTSHIMASIIASNADALASIDIGDTQEAEADPSAFAYGRAGGYGIYAGDDVDNSGLITVITNGGTADANAMVERAYLYGPAYVRAAADANMAVYGIRAGGEVDNSANVVLITAGHHANAYADADITARAWAQANADANTYAIHARGDVDGTGNVNIMASGGTTQADARAADEAYASASADAAAYGIYSSEGSVASAGNMAIDATGSTSYATAAGDGDASALATANADAYGIHAAVDASNGGTVSVNARAGAAHADANAPSDAYAYAIADAYAYGVYAGANAASDNRLNIWAVGGTAVATAVSEGDAHFAVSADAYAYGVYAGGDVNNTGEVDVNAVGGHVTTLSGADPNADAHGAAVWVAGAATNSGDLAVAAVGGTVDAHESSAHADASATGISTAGTTSNTGDITATAIGGTATSDNYAQVTASATGITTSGADADIYNSGALSISAIGGTVTDSYILNHAGSDTSPDASAYGISTVADVNNAGALSVTATGGTGVNAAGDPDHIGYANLYAMTDAVGIHAHDVNNTAGIAATAIGADLTVATTGKTTAFAYDSTSAVGIVAEMDATNSGEISVAAVSGDVTATADTYASAYSSPVAHGIYADGNVTNSGEVTVQALAGAATSSSNAYASSYGVGISDIDLSQDTLYSVVNSGAITVTSAGGEAEGQDDSLNSAATAQAYGLAFCGDVVNSGNITTQAIGGIVDTQNVAYAYAYTVGINASSVYLDEGEDVVPMSLTNSGAITAMAIGGTADSNGLTDAYAGASGIAFHGSVDNHDEITITAIGGTADSHDGVKGDVYGAYSATAYAEAQGLNAYDGDVNNTAAVTIVALAGTADAQDSAGAYAYARGVFAHGDVNNTGTIAVTSVGGTADANDVTDAYATAYGVYARDGVNNTGQVTAFAAGGTATGDEADGGAIAYGIYAQGDVNNTGTITVVGQAQDGFTSHVYGVYMDADGSLTNTGIIRTVGDETYEVCVASGTTTLVDTYNVTLDGDPSQASFFIADGATLALNDATLTVSDVEGESRWNTRYRLFAIDSNGVVDGNFADVRAVNPDVDAFYYTQGTSNVVDDTVSLGYSPAASENIESASVEKQLIAQATDVVNYHMTSTLLQNILSPNKSALLADAGPAAESFALAETTSNKDAGVFVEPYYSQIDKEANPLGYDARLWGFAAGYEQYVGDSLLGLHLGYGRSNIDYCGVGYGSNSEDQDVFTGGFNGLTRWDLWTLRYGVTGFYGSHDYEGLTGTSLDEQETASFHSYGAAGTLMGGRIFRRGPHVWLPEAGLNWLWAHRERYTTEATDSSWNATYSTMDDHDLQAEVAMRWLGSFTHDEIHIAPSASVGIRHLLTDAETSATQSVPGTSPVDVQSERERTAMMLSGSVTLTKTPHALSLAYDGEYSPDTQRHNVWLRFSWLF